MPICATKGIKRCTQAKQSHVTSACVRSSQKEWLAAWQHHMRQNKRQTHHGVGEHGGAKASVALTSFVERVAVARRVHVKWAACVQVHTRRT